MLANYLSITNYFFVTLTRAHHKGLLTYKGNQSKADFQENPQSINTLWGML